MNYERSYKAENLDAFKVGGQPQAFYDTISPYNTKNGVYQEEE
jgi:hypothetical protein